MWPDREIDIAGISDIDKGYSVHRVYPVVHVLMYIVSGSLHCDIGLGAPQEIKAGSILFLTAGCVHKYHAEKPTRIMWFHLLPDADCWQKISLDESFVRMSEWENNLSSVLELLCRESNISYSPDGVMLNLLCRVAVMYIHRELEHNRKADQHIRLRKAFQVVSDNPARQWTSADVAKIAGMSEPNLYLVVRQIYGKSPGALLKDIRMNCAAKLLSCTNQKLDLIAQQTGFSCGFALSRAFRRYFKVSPGEYRKKF